MIRVPQSTQLVVFFGVIFFETVIILGIILGADALIEDTGIRMAVAFGAATFVGAVVLKGLWALVQQSAERIEASQAMANSAWNLGLTRSLLEHPEHGTQVRLLVAGITRYYDSRPTIDRLPRQILDDSLSATQRMLAPALLTGEMQIDLEDIRQYGITIMDSAAEGDELFATSHIYSPLWWSEAPGRLYTHRKIVCARRGARVVQVFLPETSQELKEIEGLVSQMAAAPMPAGRQPIEVYAIDATRLGDLREDVPHFPYQPCRACRNQQQRYPM